MATALQPGALTPSQTQQTGSKKAVSLIDSLLTQPSLPQGTSITPQVQNVQTNELLTTPGVTGTVAAQSTAATAPTAAGVTGATPTAVSTVTPATAGQVTPATIGTASQMQAAQGTVTAPMTAATQSLANLDPRATVQGQLAGLQSGLANQQLGFATTQPQQGQLQSGYEWSRQAFPCKYLSTNSINGSVIIGIFWLFQPKWLCRAPKN